MQPRFAQRKRTGRFVAQPPNRAAFDFLKLRERATPNHASDVAYWTELQAGMPHASESHDDDEGGEEPSRPPRRSSGSRSTASRS